MFRLLMWFLMDDVGSIMFLSISAVIFFVCSWYLWQDFRREQE